MFQKTILDNGIRVVTETHRHSRSVATGIWLDTGTRDEKPEEAGLSHFLEHMVFKGTKSRSPYRIARELEAVGGDLNAFTSQENTCFHATTLKDHLELQIDVLSDLVVNAKFDGRELEREKQVVLQEIAMTVDQPDEHVFDLYFSKIFGQHPLGRPILGTAETVERFRKTDIKKYFERRYTNKNMVISCAGSVDHEQFVKLVEKYLGGLKRRLEPRKRTRPRFHPIRSVLTKETEQTHILIGAQAASFKDRHRFEAFLLNSLLGGGMTSRLYQSIRERRGLAYSVYSQLSTFTDFGTIVVYAGTEAKQAKTVMGLIVSELKKLGQKKIAESDLKLFKTQLRGALLMGADDVDNRMNSLGINELVFGEYRPVDRVVEEIRAVSLKSLREYVEERIDMTKLAFVLMGALDQDEILEEIEGLI